MGTLRGFPYQRIVSSLAYEVALLQRRQQALGFLDRRIRGKDHRGIPGLGPAASHGHHAAGAEDRPHGHRTPKQLPLGRRQCGHARLGCRLGAERDGLLVSALCVERPRTRRGCDQNAVLVIHAEELLKQEGIAAGLDGGPLCQTRRQLLCAERTLDEHIHLQGRKRLHVDARVAAFLLHPLGPAHEELRPSCGHQHDWRLAQFGGQALQHI